MPSCRNTTHGPAGLSTVRRSSCGRPTRRSDERETPLLGDRRTGRPVANAIVWQCRRTAPQCEALRAQGHEPDIRRRTGLVLDAYFSGTKLRWLLEHVRGAA